MTSLSQYTMAIVFMAAPGVESAGLRGEKMQFSQAGTAMEGPAVRPAAYSALVQISYSRDPDSVAANISTDAARYQNLHQRF